MENASKALIIAGSILIALVVISLGIVVFNNFRDSAEKNADLTAQEVGDFNSQFTKYSSESIAGSQVNDLIQKVIAVNLSSYNEGRANGDRYVKITFPSVSGGTETINGSISGLSENASKLNKVASNKMYKVQLKYTKGIVSEITVTQN